MKKATKEVAPALATDISTKAAQQMTAAQAEYIRASALVVSDQAGYESAGEYIAGLKATAKQLEAERTELVGPLNAVVKKINAKFKPHADAIEKAIRTVNDKMVTWFRAEEQKRLAQEAIDAEKARKEKEKLEKQAATATAKGQVEKAAVLEQRAEMVNTNPIAPVTERQTAQTTMVTTYSAQVFDKLSLIEAVAKGLVSMETLDCNMTVLNGLARAQKETLNIPGVRAISSTNVRAK